MNEDSTRLILHIHREYSIECKPYLMTAVKCSYKLCWAGQCYKIQKFHW